MRMCILEKIIDLKDITVKYGENVVLDKLNLYINKKEFITLLGPSGCGKTTTLRCIAGFIEPDGGDIIFEGKRINDVPPHKRKVNTIFQRYALFSHLNVYENIAFGLKLQKKPKSTCGELASALAIATLCCCPPESESMLLFSKPLRFTSSSISATVFLISLFGFF